MVRATTFVEIFGRFLSDARRLGFAWVVDLPAFEALLEAPLAGFGVAALFEGVVAAFLDFGPLPGGALRGGALPGGGDSRGIKVNGTQFMVCSQKERRQGGGGEEVKFFSAQSPNT